MIYVMECGPLVDGAWLVFSLDSASGQTKVRAMEDRHEARRAVACELTHASGVACCASLSDFGRERGWRVQSVPEDVLRLAAQTLVSIENKESLGMLGFSPTADAWLRTSAMFLDAEPWTRLSMKTPLSVTFSDDPQVPRVAGVGGASVMPPSLILLPDRSAYERFAGRGEKTGLEDAIICGFDYLDGALSEAIGLAYGQTFHPVLLRLRRGKGVLVTEVELAHLAAALGAVASFASGKAVGRAVIDGLEALAWPLTAEESLRS